MKYFFLVNGVTDENKKKVILLSAIGPTQFRLIKDLVQPENLDNKSFAQICGLLKNHHEPTPPLFLQRALFENQGRVYKITLQA